MILEGLCNGKNMPARMMVAPTSIDKRVVSDIICPTYVHQSLLVLFTDVSQFNLTLGTSSCYPNPTAMRPSCFGRKDGQAGRVMRYGLLMTGTDDKRMLGLIIVFTVPGAIANSCTLNYVRMIIM
jgi:hypothetical protein